MENDHFIRKIKCAAKVTLVLWFILKNLGKARFRSFNAHENKYHARSIQTCVHQRQVDKAKGCSQRN